MTASDSRAAARQLLAVVMLVMRSLSTEMRRTEQALAPAQLATLMRLAAARFSAPRYSAPPPRRQPADGLEIGRAC